MKLFTYNQNFKLLKYEKEWNELIRYTLDQGLKRITSNLDENEQDLTGINGYFEH